MSEKLKPYQFQPGQSGNPGGRPRGAERIARDVLAARSYTAKDGTVYTGPEAAIHCLLDIAYDLKEPARERREAAKAALDRGYGTPKQTVAITEGEAGTDDDLRKKSTEDLLAIIARGESADGGSVH